MDQVHVIRHQVLGGVLGLAAFTRVTRSLREIFGRRVRELPHRRVVDDQQRDGGELYEVRFARPRECASAIMRRYERASTLLTSNRPVDEWASCWGTPRRDPPARSLASSRPRSLTCEPRSWRTKLHTDLRPEESVR